jgi:prolipoprotein diacylglyceryltransferase
MIVPHLYFYFGNKRIQSFHFFGVVGYLLGSVLGVILSVQLDLQQSLILLMAGIGAATFFLLALAARWITGEETIVYYHHEISIIALCALVLYILNKPVLPYLDITLLGIGIFLGFGRIGCYSVGCCHGRPHKQGVKYGQAHVDAGFTWFYKDIPLLPVQLIESAYVFLTVIAGVILLLRHTVPGTVLIVYTVVYGLMRFILEYFRGDPDRPLWKGVTEAQWTTIVLTIVTYLMSRMGWLPSYNWHWIIMTGMVAAALITMYQFTRYPKHKLFAPPHVMQLAEGLNILEELNAGPQQIPGKINVYTTRTGFSVSCNHCITDEYPRHYTISLKNKTVMDSISVHRMAQLIGRLKNHSGPYDLIEKQNGIYHILFIDKKLNNEA